MQGFSFFESLEFDLPKALIAELVGLFDRMPAAPLTADQVGQVGDDQGVYQLFLDGQLKYIGKTDADAGLCARLQRHAKKILGRKNLDPHRVTFKAVRVYVFTAMDLESLLIRHYGLTSDNSWNNSGFGSNDPGRERDTTTLKITHFDKQFPIDLTYPVTLGYEGQTQPVYVVLSALKNQLPYLIRFQTVIGGRRAHQELVNKELSLASPTGSAESVLLQVKRALGSDWQITALPGYVILYKEQKHYVEGRVLAQDE